MPLPSMRTVWPLLALLLAACGGDEIRISGEVRWASDLQLPPEAMLTVRLDDAQGSGEAALAETRIPLEGRQPPVPFELRLARGALPASAVSLAVFARVDTETRLWLISDEAEALDPRRSRQRVRLMLEAL